MTDKPPSPFLACGIWINQNLPAVLDVGFRVDSDLPSGTIEVWQDGKRVGRIENIGTTCTCPSGDGSLRHPCPVHP